MVFRKTRREETLEEYRRMKMVVKEVLQEAKKEQMKKGPQV